MSVVWAGWIAYNTLLAALTIGVITLVIRDHRRDKAREAAEQEAEVDTDEAVELANAPAHESILDTIAANEAARLDPDHVDWTAPAKWSER